MTDALIIDDPAPESHNGAPGSVKPKRGRPKKTKLVSRVPVHETPREPIRTRNVNSGGRFVIPPELLARLPGRSVEYKKHTVLGQPDPAYEMDLKRAGWEPVQSYQMPGIMPHGYKGPIIRDGLMLYERPQELTDQARAEEYAEAVERVRNQERKLGVAGPGEMTRDHPDVRPRISKTYEPLVRRQT